MVGNVGTPVSVVWLYEEKSAVNINLLQFWTYFKQFLYSKRGMQGFRMSIIVWFSRALITQSQGKNHLVQSSNLEEEMNPDYCFCVACEA